MYCDVSEPFFCRERQFGRIALVSDGPSSTSGAQGLAALRHKSQTATDPGLDKSEGERGTRGEGLSPSSPDPSDCRYEQVSVNWPNQRIPRWRL
ncbi:hypothetical protein NDU88_005395 [Pleurodeles waltl]|uniref:Uncharacterized protein n=1 Tax=Pleurodeles waltl TaxID=8319 RepID=A0AAV7LPF3_PLEWA|nr:hypothetical protein NDU88_005395 [Pleurodeles waltl]